MLGIGEGIIGASCVLGIVAVVFRIFPKKHNPRNPGNPGNPALEKRLNGIDEKFKGVRYEDTCGEIVKRLEGTSKTINKSVESGFQAIDKRLENIEKRLP